MKLATLFFAAILACTLSLSTFSVNSYGASDTKKETTTKTAKTSKKEIPHDVNINNADKELLIQLPGIGPKTAEAIISYRNSNGKFKSVNQLTEVKGIGDKTLAKLKPYLQKI